MSACESLSGVMGKRVVLARGGQPDLVPKASEVLPRADGRPSRSSQRQQTNRTQSHDGRRRVQYAVLDEGAIRF